MIFLDSNIPMFLVGAEHPNKHASRRLLENLIAAGQRLVADAEVLQEILHRYGAIQRFDAIGPAFETLLGVVDEVYPVELRDVQAARSLMEETPGLSARDSIHWAIMRRHGIERVLSFDRGFDRCHGLVRIGDGG